MKRTKFYINGSRHPLLPIALHHLLVMGFECVSEVEEADFVLADVHSPPVGKPTVVLSTDSVYSDRDQTTKVRPKGRMKEEDPILIPSVLDQRCGEVIACVSVEHAYCMTEDSTLILRCFETYGPRIKTGFIASLFKGDSLPLYRPGYQVRTFLYEDDFLFMFERMVTRFLKGQIVGIFNVGSEEEVSLKRLYETFQQLDTTKPIVEARAPRAYRWWVVPDLTRVQALTQWTSSKTIRAGLWDLQSQGFRDDHE